MGVLGHVLRKIKWPFNNFPKYKIDIAGNANKRRHFSLERRKAMRFCFPLYFSTIGKINEVSFLLKMTHEKAPNGFFRAHAMFITE